MTDYVSLSVYTFVSDRGRHKNDVLLIPPIPLGSTWDTPEIGRWGGTSLNKAKPREGECR